MSKIKPKKRQRSVGETTEVSFTATTSSEFLIFFHVLKMIWSESGIIKRSFFNWSAICHEGYRSIAKMTVERTRQPRHSGIGDPWFRNCLITLHMTNIYGHKVRVEVEILYLAPSQWKKWFDEKPYRSLWEVKSIFARISESKKAGGRTEMFHLPGRDEQNLACGIEAERKFNNLKNELILTDEEV